MNLSQFEVSVWMDFPFFEEMDADTRWCFFTDCWGTESPGEVYLQRNDLKEIPTSLGACLYQKCDLNRFCRFLPFRALTFKDWQWDSAIHGHGRLGGGFSKSLDHFGIFNTAIEISGEWIDRKFKVQNKDIKYNAELMMNDQRIPLKGEIVSVDRDHLQEFQHQNLILDLPAMVFRSGLTNLDVCRCLKNWNCYLGALFEDKPPILVNQNIAILLDPFEHRFIFQMVVRISELNVCANLQFTNLVLKLNKITKSSQRQIHFSWSTTMSLQLGSDIIRGQFSESKDYNILLYGPAQEIIRRLSRCSYEWNFLLNLDPQTSVVPSEKVFLHYELLMKTIDAIAIEAKISLSLPRINRLEIIGRIDLLRNELTGHITTPMNGVLTSLIERIPKIKFPKNVSASTTISQTGQYQITCCKCQIKMTPRLVLKNVTLDLNNRQDLSLTFQGQLENQRIPRVDFRGQYDLSNKVWAVTSNKSSLTRFQFCDFVPASNAGEISSLLLNFNDLNSVEFRSSLNEDLEISASLGTATLKYSYSRGNYIIQIKSPDVPLQMDMIKGMRQVSKNEILIAFRDP